MHSLIKLPAILALIWLCLGGLSVAQSSEEDDNEPELPVEEAMALLDQLVPLPVVTAEEGLEPVSLILPEDQEPDYIYLRYLQIQEKLEEDTARAEAYKQKMVGAFFSKEYSEVAVNDPFAILNTPERLIIEDLLQHYPYKDTQPIICNIMTGDEASYIMKKRSAELESLIPNAPNAILIFYFYKNPADTRVYFGKKSHKLIATIDQKLTAQQATLESMDLNSDFYAIYHHLRYLTHNLPTFLKKSPHLSAQSTAPSASAPTPQPQKVTEPETKPHRRNSLMVLLPIPLLALYVFIITLITRLVYQYCAPQKARSIQPSDHDPVLGFKVAKDTSKSITF